MRDYKFTAKYRISGFTLVEMLIAVMLFSVILILGTGAVLNTNAIHKKTQKMRAIIDNMHFIMEDMARNIRLAQADENENSSISDVCGNLSNCIKFIPFYDANKTVAYRLSEDNNNIGLISKAEIESNSLSSSDFNRLTPEEVDIDIDKSGFSIDGIDPDDNEQPRVTIRLSGTIYHKKGTPQEIATPFSLQTTVSQRQLDAE